ncbi:ArsR/SmtB family transcription factor [Halobellus clavatus]|uniref:Helix-turn-helix domain-containing protein n=1 Tax=Halobellus clavatus TaxID=660517 RepID=A0A1H3G9X6_9EURY|nr:winged helix-turn-helix domain-containing protein [Halobellus clavatus]SDY00133.1 Helix-turn-helix domain-containing protein [Halobellus clavatus]
MADLLPSRPEISDDDKEPRVVGLDSDDVDDLLAAISSETARQVLSEIHEEPGPPSDLADRIDTSIQNAQYHLDRLESAGLIEPAGTAYSAKGREMTVYAPSDQALVVVAGNEDDTSGLQSALTQLLGGLGAIALGSVVVDRLARTGVGPDLAPTAGSGGADGGASTAGADGGATNLSEQGTAEPSATPTPDAETAAATETGDDGISIAEATDTPTESAAETATPTPQPESTEPAATATETATQIATDQVQTAAATTQAAGDGVGPLDAIGSAIGGVPPGALFFLGGVVALSFVALVWRQ